MTTATQPTPTNLPTATPDAMALLARLLDEGGVGLRVSAGGELQLRDCDKRLSPADRVTLNHYRHDLAGWLTAAESIEAGSQPVAYPSAPGGEHPRCERCGAGLFTESPIHGGASVRRDCAACGRTWGFPVWHGEAA